MLKSIKKRKNISDYIDSLLKAEICNRCPICGKFGGFKKIFTNHHIDYNSSNSRYWNLICICQSCHDEINERKQDGHLERKIKQIKKDIFRRLIGSASYEVLLMASKHKIISTLPCLANILLKMSIVKVVQENPMTVGMADHPTISDYSITNKGRDIVDNLKLI